MNLTLRNFFVSAVALAPAGHFFTKMRSALLCFGLMASSHCGSTIYAQNQPAAMQNRLKDQTSPYLLQHASNPVDWYPWGEEAFAKAKRENKPIFLSVGYSTCYWCHVMELESFENQQVAEVLNEHFVAIKVDREERPDVDEQYMIATQLLTRQGGWPNSVWLTPAGKPWMAGTYFPQERFVDVLRTLAELWKNKREEIDRQADLLAAATKEVGSPEFDAAVPLSQRLIDQAVALHLERFDDRHGGFGDAPKFPPHGPLRMLMGQYDRTKDAALLKVITTTLDAMWQGGLHDHLGGGFHRYSTDRVWLLPHFEKMLYDNAQLTRIYADGFKLTGKREYRVAVAGIFKWLEREMTASGGAFYSAIDSGEVGKEGEAYVWKMDRLRQVLTAEEAELFSQVYQLQPEGNFLEEATKERTGANIPHLREAFGGTAERLATGADDLQQRLTAIREKLLTDRQSWPQPHKDDKILAGWNGLMIAALAYAGQTLEEPRYINAAVEAAEFVWDTMLIDGQLMRSLRDGKATQPGYLDDYVYLTDALLELFVATENSRWLDRAMRLTEIWISEFADIDHGGFFFTGRIHDELLVRSKQLGGGGNVPSPNGVAARVLIQLSRLSDQLHYFNLAQQTLSWLSPMMQQQPTACDDFFVALSMWLQQDSSGAEKSMQTNWKRNTKETVVGPVRLQLTSDSRVVKAGQTLQLTVGLQIDDGWHLYGENPDAAFLRPTTVTLQEHPNWKLVELRAPTGQTKKDPVLNQTLNVFSGSIAFVLELAARQDAVPGKGTVTVEVNSQACDDQRCLSPTKSELRIELEIRQ